MNKYQKEVENQLLENEKQILEELKQNYAKALADVKERIKSLTNSEITQSKIYQKQYQENLEKQLQSIIDLLSADNVQSISEYLEKTYQDGFIGTLYNMQNEGVPFIMPINQETVIKSITKKTEDFQLSKTLYQNAEELKKTIKTEITRGISQASGYNKIAQLITLNSEADLKKSYRIARTEGGRVQSESRFETMQRAKANGADVVKEWDSTLDRRTRDTHARLDGQLKELEESFEIDGREAMYPHDFGIASEDINCRCCVLERARWAVEDNESFTKNIDGDIVEFKNVKDYQEYKEKYFNFYKNRDTMNKTNKEVKDVQYVGKLDKNKFKGISEKILTDEVVLTDKQRQHIIDRHPEIYDMVKDRFEEIIKMPDFILKDNSRDNTALIVKTLKQDDKSVNLVIRLAVEGDNEKNKNSIITCIPIGKNRLKSYKNNGKIVYKNE